MVCLTPLIPSWELATGSLLDGTRSCATRWTASPCHLRLSPGTLSLHPPQSCQNVWLWSVSRPIFPSGLRAPEGKGPAPFTSVSPALGTVLDERMSWIRASSASGLVWPWRQKVLPGSSWAWGGQGLPGQRLKGDLPRKNKRQREWFGPLERFASSSPWHLLGWKGLKLWEVWNTYSS